MSNKNETVILGAGLSGMIASIILAREGRKVKVIDGAKDIGGNLMFHPSLHATPIDVDKVAAWTGLDTDRMFYKGTGVESFVGTQSFYQEPMYLVERGNRPTAIDTYLFAEAKKLGVEFEFGRHVNDPKELPKGSIIATGYHSAMYRAFNIPCSTGEGFYKVAENNDPELEGKVFCWIAPYTRDYAYAVVQNGMKYILLLSRFQLPETALDDYQKHLKDTLGWEFDDWGVIKLPYPWSFKRPLLWVDDYILTGSAGRNIDPMGGFGIHGAILSGVIAAWAITDPAKAEKELKDINKHFVSTTLAFEVVKRMPFREKFFRIVLTVPEIFRPPMFFMGRGIPGYKGNWAYNVIKGYQKGRGLAERIRDLKKIFKY